LLLMNLVMKCRRGLKLFRSNLYRKKTQSAKIGS
jgi:hypothetical protein